MARLRAADGSGPQIEDLYPRGEGIDSQQVDLGPSPDVLDRSAGSGDGEQGNRHTPDVGPVSGLEAQSGETPRERASVQPRSLGEGASGEGQPSAQATLRRPSSPSPMAGSTFQSGVLPFAQFGSPDVGSLATPRSGGLYGESGGLMGGGLGVPLDPQSNQLSPSIEQLIQQLMGK